MVVTFKGLFVFLAAVSNACDYDSLMRIPGIAIEIGVVLIGVCIGTVRLAIKDFRAYKEKRRQRSNSKLNP